MPFPDVGKIIAVYVSLESEGEVPSKKKRSIETAREMKRFWNTDGYTLGNVSSLVGMKESKNVLIK